MKNKIIPFLALCLISISYAYADNHNNKVSYDDIKQDAKALMSTLRQYGIDQRDEAMRQAQIALEKIDARIDELETRVDENWDQMSEAAQQRTRSTLKSLRQQRNQVAERYGSLKTSSSDAWEQMKDGFSAAYDELSDSWEKAKAEYESDDQADSKAKINSDSNQDTGNK